MSSGSHLAFWGHRRLVRERLTCLSVDFTGRFLGLSSDLPLTAFTQSCWPTLPETGLRQSLWTSSFLLLTPLPNPHSFYGSAMLFLLRPTYKTCSPRGNCLSLLLSTDGWSSSSHLLRAALRSAFRGHLGCYSCNY